MEYIYHKSPVFGRCFVSLRVRKAPHHKGETLSRQYFPFQASISPGPRQAVAAGQGEGDPILLSVMAFPRDYYKIYSLLSQFPVSLNSSIRSGPG